MREISIEADQVKRSTISDLRTAARNDGIFGDGEETEPTRRQFEKLQHAYTCVIEDKIITIKLSEKTPKENLLEIKTILE
jgi:hypothetical protein